MKNFTKENVNDLLLNQIDPEKLILKYPEFREVVIKEFNSINDKNNMDSVISLLNKYKDRASFAIKKIKISGKNPKTLRAFLPDIIKARIAIYILEQTNLFFQNQKTSKKSNRVRFNLWDGFILQKILFKKGFVRKPVSTVLFKIFWPFISNKKILIPLVNQKGIYCFYSKKLINELYKLIGSTNCIEVAAGDGTLTKFLNQKGLSCIPTDDYSWESYIQYPEFVQKLNAKKALEKYNPETVICSWAPPGNTFEKYIFQTVSVKLYIVMGSKNSLYTGNHDVYNSQKNFTMEYNKYLSDLLLPPSKDNAIYIFKRKN